jgi:hypothetical protein
MTIDPFVLLAPILLLAVIALLRFVGCDILFRIDQVPTDTPTIMSFVPPDATAGDGVSTPFELTLIGSGFVDGLKVKFGTADLTPGSVADTEIKVTVPATELATPNTTPGVTVTVTNPDGGTSSLSYTIQELDKVTFSGPEPTTPPGGPPAAPPGAAYKNLVFDANWWWERTTVENNLNHVYLVPGQTSGSFTFANGPRLLKSMNVSANPAGTITVSSDNSQNQPVSQPIPITTGQSVTVATNWKLKSTSVTVTFTAINSIGIDTITYQGPP